MAAAAVLWVGFVYTGIIAFGLHFVPHFFAWRLRGDLVIFFMLDLLLLELLAVLYKQLPFRPRSAVFRWLEKFSVL